MKQSIDIIFARPVNETYYEYGVNNLERMKWIERDTLRHFISDNIPLSVISIKEIRELVDGYESFIIDNANKEWYTFDFEMNKNDISKVVKSKDLLNPKDNDMFSKTVTKLKSYNLDFNKK